MVVKTIDVNELSTEAHLIVVPKEMAEDEHLRQLSKLCESIPDAYRDSASYDSRLETGYVFKRNGTRTCG